MSEADAGRTHHFVTLLDQWVLSFSRHWLAWVNLAVGVWVLLPWVAPVLMQMGATGPAQLLYAFYGLQCHQLPQRSYFLFGTRFMIPLNDILAAWPAADPLLLRPFVGNGQLGWKVAWSDRMVSLYTPLLVGGLLYGLTGKRWKPLPIRGWLLFGVPLLVDGGSHFINDAFGLGVRDTNSWLGALTGHVMGPTFFTGDFLGSFNWWLRLLSGALAGFATVWLVYPHLGRAFRITQSTCIENQANHPSPADAGRQPGWLHHHAKS